MSNLQDSNARGKKSRIVRPARCKILFVGPPILNNLNLQSSHCEMSVYGLGNTAQSKFWIRIMDAALIAFAIGLYLGFPQAYSITKSKPKLFHHFESSRHAWLQRTRSLGSFDLARPGIIEIES